MEGSCATWTIRARIVLISITRSLRAVYARARRSGLSAKVPSESRLTKPRITASGVRSS